MSENLKSIEDIIDCEINAIPNKLLLNRTGLKVILTKAINKFLSTQKIHFHREDKAKYGTCKCYDCAVMKRELATPALVCRQLVAHGYCPNCGCDQWNTKGCPTCPVIRRAYHALHILGEVPKRKFALFMQADEINKQNMNSKQS